MKKSFFLILSILVLPVSSQVQNGFNFKNGIHEEVIKFKLINNLIILPIKVNNVELSFILDTGVSSPILFNIYESDSLQIKNIEEINLKGLGEGDPIKAFRSSNNTFRIGEVYNNTQDLFVVLDSEINFSPRLGVPVHGIIGYDLFKNFIVKINYRQEKIKLLKPDGYEHKDCNKCETFNLEMIRNKPYINAYINNGGRTNKVKLLIDSGSSDALWLFEDKNAGILIPEKNFTDFLGRGLSGSVYGRKAKINSFSLGGFELENVNVSFPDSLSIQHLSGLGNRNGSVGGEVLKRFNVTFDYPNQKITLKRNGYFKNPFRFNLSGIELMHNGLRIVEHKKRIPAGVVKNSDPTGEIQIVMSDRLRVELHPAFEIAEIRKGSPAEEAGLKVGDVMVYVNGKDVYGETLQEVSQMLNEKPGKKIRIVVDRNGIELRFAFELRELL